MGEGEWDFEAFERDILKLASVASALVEGDEVKGRVTAVHVVSDGTKDVRQLKRDVETLAKAEHRIPIDHRVISITERKGAAPVRSIGPELELVSVAVTTQGSMADCSVALRRADDRGAATDSAPATRPSILKLVARTTLAAVSDLVGSRVPADVQKALFLADSPVAIVVLEFADEEGTASISPGVTVSKGDDYRAIALALLDAFDRRDM